MKIVVVTLIFLLFSNPLLAAKIQFPDEELAQESVLPVFDDSQAVKNRNVVTEKN